MVELVWDSGQAATAKTASGASLTIGDPSGYSPTDLVALGAAADLMQAFLSASAAAGVPILGYMANATFQASHDERPPRLRVRSFVVGSGEVSERELEALADEAARTSQVTRLLGDRCEAEWDVRALHGA